MLKMSMVVWKIFAISVEFVILFTTWFMDKIQEFKKIKNICFILYIILLHNVIYLEILIDF